MNWSDYFYYDETSPSCLRWKVNRRVARKGNQAGWLMGEGYWAVQVNKKSYLVHRIIWELHNEELEKYLLDHIDNDRTNNRLANLQKITNTNNTRKSKISKNNQSGYKGVYKVRNKFASRIGYDNKGIHLGYFLSPEEAARAYDEKAIELFGEFALTNEKLGLL